MLVRSDVYNLAFGYRKYSIAEAFEKVAQERNFLERFLVSILEHVPVWNPKTGDYGLLRKKAALRVAQAEHIWQELVRVVKDIWVIKNLVTLLGNEFANFTLLMLAGVNPVAFLKHKAIAISSTHAYLRDQKERDALQRQLDSGYLGGGDADAMRQRVIELDDALKRNPVRDLVDAGMFQTLVEDIAQEQDEYSYKSRLTRWSDSNTRWLPQPVKTAGKHLVLAHDTVPYRLLNQATIYSDFTARYVMVQHLTKRRNPLTKEEALRRARAAFVNYDVPAHKGIQYLNDIGVLNFTKYYVRIQAVILDLVKENPWRALNVMGLGDWLFSLPDILDASILENFPGSWGRGAAELPGAVGEIITLKAVGAPL